MNKMLLNSSYDGGRGKDSPSRQNWKSEGCSIKRSCSFHWSHLISNLEKKLINKILYNFYFLANEDPRPIFHEFLVSQNLNGM